MTSRRRNLFVILLMAGLLLASLVVIATKPTRLGLDLKGGVELVYQGEPTPQTKVTPGGGRPLDRHHPRARRPAGRRRARDPAHRPGPDLGRAARRQGPGPREEAGRHHRPALLLRLGEERDRERRRRRSRPSTTRSRRRIAAPAGDRRQQHAPAPSTTCSRRTTQLAAGPDSSRKDLLSQFDGRVPRGYEIADGAAGHRRRAGREARRLPERQALRPLLRAARQPGAEGHGHQEPRAAVRQRRAAAARRSSPSSSPTRGARPSRT